MGKKKPRTTQTRKKEKAGERSQRDYVILGLLLAVFVLAMFLRLRFVTNPLLDFHSQRQCDTAAVARNFVDEGMNIFYPRIDWRGATQGFIEMEFPLYPYLIALLYFLFGVNEIIGRYVSILFAAGTFLYLYLLGRKLFGERGALFSVGFFAFAPLGVYFTRTFQPESMYLFFATASLFHFTEYLDRHENKQFVITAVFLAIAASLKIAILVALFFPYLGFALNKKGFSLFKDVRIWAIAIIGAAPAALWQIQAGQLYELSQLSFSRWLMGREAFFSLERFLTPQYWQVAVIPRFPQNLTYLGIVVILVGLVASATRRQWHPILWLNIGFWFYFFFFMQANFPHHYYQLIGMIAFSMAFGVGAEWLLGFIKVEKQAMMGIMTAALVIILALGTYSYYLLTPNWYGTMWPYQTLGSALERVSQPGDLVVTVIDFGFGELLYYSHRKGWTTSGVPDVKGAQSYADQGAKFICAFLRLNEKENNTANMNELAQEYPIVHQDQFGVIFALAER